MESSKLEPSKKPLNVLIKQLNAQVTITLKNGVEYKGRMTRCDGHMNIMLDGASESMKDKLIANYGTVLVRGNNILYIELDTGRGKYWNPVLASFLASMMVIAAVLIVTVIVRERRALLQ